MYEHTAVILAVIQRQIEVLECEAFENLVMDDDVVRIHQQFLKILVEVIDDLLPRPVPDGVDGENLSRQLLIKARLTHLLCDTDTLHHGFFRVLVKSLACRVLKVETDTVRTGNGVCNQCDSQLLVSHSISSVIYDILIFYLKAVRQQKLLPTVRPVEAALKRQLADFSAVTP